LAIPSFDKLSKILKLEIESGFRDKAVIGGLGKFADFWEKEASREAPAKVVAQIVELLRGYSALADRPARVQALERIKTLMSAQVSVPPVQAAPRPPEPKPAAAPEPTQAGAPATGPESVTPPAEPKTVASPTPAATPAMAPPPARPVPRPPAQTATVPVIVPRQAAQVERLGLDASITVLTGISTAYAERFARLGVRTIRDLLFLLPRRYDDYRNLKPINRLEYGEEVTIIASVWDAGTRRTRGGAPIFTATLSDGSGTIQCTWFNQPYLADRIKPKMQIVVSGKVEEYLGNLTFQSPEWEPLERELLHTARLVPVYPLTEGIGGKWLRKLMKRTVDYWSSRVQEHLPDSVRQSAGLMNVSDALTHIHFPDDWSDLERARQRLAFDELFVVQLGVMRQRQAWRSQPGRALDFERTVVDRFVKSLPFVLTGAQKHALDQIVGDLKSSVPMNRLLQGDVGSGKTVVAAAAMVATVATGAQAALMAPTEILAEQHFKTLGAVFAHLQKPPVVELLTGGTPNKDGLYARLASGEINIVVGTHALIQPNVAFRNLAFLVIDEQHRFGVEQRAALRQKGQGKFNPHVLVMTATPIPRTLALTLYGDLDVSIVNEMPPGRQKIETRWLYPTERERAYAFIRTQVEKGHQAFVICPLVEESEKVEAKAAVEEHERLQKQVFPSLKLGLLHGRMKSDEKDEVMGAFARGDLHVLVSTSVVEVGIDVPNATVMLVEGANRFGLAQLHQFRGRVGRGQHASYCLLLADSTTAASDERLKAIESTNDGFVLAEKDLELRGPGEFFGTRQAGLPDLRVAKLADVKLLDLAREQAHKLFEADPNLSAPEHRLLAQKVERFWAASSDAS
jgi:ATP-dependent DNA helicase RecG